MDIVQEPNIRQAQFIVTNTRIYTLEFDHNLQMKELKLMIQVAAHLKRNNFRLFSEGEEYTQCNEETFESLFPNKKLVVFTLEKSEGEVFDEAELLIQINNPCPEHNERFLFYYCYDCNCSVCSDCFTKGKHKGHRVQDKSYYLLPSKFLVEKLFESWSRNPYDDYNISVDLSSYKKNLNEVVFTKLFQMLKQVQDKCNELIDAYNSINYNNLGNVRDSVRDIKAACIKKLDELKEKMKVKDIVVDSKIFKDFDNAYKDLGRQMNEKFNYNLLVFKELNQSVSIKVKEQIDKIYNTILNLLKQCLEDPQFSIVLGQISQKKIAPVIQNF